ncbi:MAG: hypothetical protein RG741_06280 [Bacteroidales bacterium]|nr:hypothetical protein [Bacteroidales bacterium]
MKRGLQTNYPLLNMVIMMMVVLFLWSCGDGQKQAQQAKLKEVQESTCMQLNDLKKDIEKRIAYLDTQIETAKGELQENLKEVRAELKMQQEIIEKEMELVRASSLETWDSVLSDVRKKYQDARTKTNEVSKKVREWLENGD